MLIRPISSGSQRGNCMLVSDGQTPIIIDAGLRGWQINQALGHTLHTVKGALISHEHGDHSKGVSDLALRGIPIFASLGTLEALKMLGSPMARPVPAGTAFFAGSWLCQAFPTKHDAAEAFGFYLISSTSGESAVYITDTPYTRYVMPACTHVMIEANYDIDKLRAAERTGALPSKAVSRIRWSHFSIQSAIKFLKASDLSRCVGIWLLHLSDDRSDAEDFRRRVMAATGKPTWVA